MVGERFCKPLAAKRSFPVCCALPSPQLGNEGDLPFLKSYVRRVALAWDPRAAAVRETVSQASAYLSAILSRQKSPEAI